MVISDGNYFFSGLFDRQLNGKINSGELSIFSVIKIREFLIDTMPSGQKIVIVLKCDQLRNHGSRIGRPSDVAKAPCHKYKQCSITEEEIIECLCSEAWINDTTVDDDIPLSQLASNVPNSNLPSEAWIIDDTMVGDYSSSSGEDIPLSQLASNV